MLLPVPWEMPYHLQESIDQLISDIESRHDWWDEFQLIVNEARVAAAEGRL